MLNKIYQELVLIRKELQSIRSDKEFCTDTGIDGNELAKVVRKASHDNG